MIRGVGVDIVEVRRFACWHTYSIKKLKRIFTQQEIEYCLQSTPNSAQRFAVRFAAKEALAKGLTAAGLSLPLLFICRHASIVKNEHDAHPVFMLTDELKEKISAAIAIHVTLSHSKDHGVAFVVIERIRDISRQKFHN